MRPEHLSAFYELIRREELKLYKGRLKIFSQKTQIFNSLVRKPGVSRNTHHSALRLKESRTCCAKIRVPAACFCFLVSLAIGPAAQKSAHRLKRECLQT